MGRRPRPTAQGAGAGRDHICHQAADCLQLDRGGARWRRAMRLGFGRCRLRLRFTAAAITGDARAALSMYWRCARTIVSGCLATNGVWSRQSLPRWPMSWRRRNGQRWRLARDRKACDLSRKSAGLSLGCFSGHPYRRASSWRSRYGEEAAGSRPRAPIIDIIKCNCSTRRRVTALLQVEIGLSAEVAAPSSSFPQRSV